MAALRELVLSYRLVFTSLSRNCKNAVPSATAVSRKNYSTAVEDEEKYDVIVTGGGMIGATLACAIGNNRRLEGKKVLLLESNAKQQYTPQEQYSNRVVTLNNQTRILLSSLGAWQHIEAVRYCPVRKMQVWDACSDAMITFNEDHLSEELAYIVENDLLLHAINKQLFQKENVTVIYESKITDVKLPKTSAEFAFVQLQSGKRYAARLLAIMTGWGATEMGPRSQELLQAKLSLVTNDQCREAYRRLTQIWHKQLCAGGLREVDSCFGDSGGPLQALGIYNGNTARFVQYGVVSFGSRECGIAGVPGVYTRVAYYVDWILNTMTD